MARYFCCCTDYIYRFIHLKHLKLRENRVWNFEWCELQSQNTWYPTFVLWYRNSHLGKQLSEAKQRRVRHRNNSVRSAQSAVFPSQSMSMSPAFRRYSEANCWRVRSVNNGSCRTLFCTVTVAWNIFLSYIVENYATFCVLSQIFSFGLLFIEK